MAYLSSDLSESLTDELIEKLNKANVWTVNDILANDLIEIRRATNIKYVTLKDIQDKARQRYTLPCQELNFLLQKSIQECKMCPTGLPELTQALDGGFQTQEIVEFFGDSETGKTEMCLLLCGEILTHYEDYRILYVSSQSDVDHEKIIKYIKSKAGNREMTEDDIFKCLNRLDIARPTKLTDLVHLLNTFVHSDKRRAIKCIIIDSLSFIIQEDILDIRTADLETQQDLEKFSALKATLFHRETGATVESIKRDLTDIYLHEVMRLITNIAFNQNVIVVITNSDQQLTYSNSWTNAIDHRVHLSKICEFSRYSIHNPRSTVCEATIVKTIHNISKIGYSIPFAINDEGLFAIRLKASEPTQSESTSAPNDGSGTSKDIT